MSPDTTSATTPESAQSRESGADPAAGSDANAARGSRKREGRRRLRAGTGLLAAAAVLVAGLGIDYPYVIEGPGPTANVLGTYQDKPVISITGHQSYPAQGELRMTTVSISGGPGSRTTGFELLGAALSPKKKIMPEDEIYPKGSTQQQVRDASRLEMQNSQSSAVAAVLAREKIPYTTKVVVESLSEGSASAGKLAAGDQILAIDSVLVKDSAQIRTQVAKGQGAPVRVKVRRDGVEKTFSITPLKGEGRYLLGILIRNDFDFPFDVKISLGDIGGPSAGLMFSLGILDTLTPGDLTGGRAVAGTGTITAAGVVGPIGGIQQKMYGAQASGAQFFLAPAENCPDVVAGVIPKGLTVVKVGTLDEAVRTVQAIADGKTRQSEPASFPLCGQ